MFKAIRDLRKEVRRKEAHWKFRVHMDQEKNSEGKLASEFRWEKKLVKKLPMLVFPYQTLCNELFMWS